MNIKHEIVTFLNKNVDILSIAGIDITTTFIGIDIAAKAATSVIILLIAFRRFKKKK